MTEITPQAKFRPAEGLDISRVPDGAMVYQAERERVHYLNPTALVVFELCGLDKTAGEIEAFMSDAFSLAAPPADAVHACLVSLVEEGLIECVPSSAGH